MAKQTRRQFKIFGSGGVISAPTQFSVFGSLAAGGPPGTKSTDVGTIQSLAAWSLGWFAAIIGANKARALEDINSLWYVVAYMIGQIFQDGIPQWEVATTYTVGSLVQDNAGLGQVFQCLVDGTVGGTLPVGASTGVWLWMNPPALLPTTAFTAGQIPKVTGVAGIGPSGSLATAPSAISDNGTNVVLAVPLVFPDGSPQSTSAAPFTSTNIYTSAQRGYNQDIPPSSKLRFVVVSSVATDGPATMEAYTDSGHVDSDAFYGGNGSEEANKKLKVSFYIMPNRAASVNTTGTVPFGTWTEYQ